MQEKEYVNVGNLARLRTAMRLMQECVFLDYAENNKCGNIIHEICGLEFHTNNKIKIAPQNTAEAGEVRMTPMEATGQSTPWGGDLDNLKANTDAIEKRAQQEKKLDEYFAHKHPLKIQKMVPAGNRYKPGTRVIDGVSTMCIIDFGETGLPIVCFFHYDTPSSVVDRIASALNKLEKGPPTENTVKG
jgi:hypothetical protein